MTVVPYCRLAVGRLLFLPLVASTAVKLPLLALVGLRIARARERIPGCSFDNNHFDHTNEGERTTLISNCDVSFYHDVRIHTTYARTQFNHNDATGQLRLEMSLDNGPWQLNGVYSTRRSSEFNNMSTSPHNTRYLYMSYQSVAVSLHCPDGNDS